MKNFLFGAAAIFALAGAAPAFADSIDFAQFGAPGSTFGSPLVGTTNGGVSFSVASPAGSFSEYLEDATRSYDYSWAGEFAKGETILYDNGGSGAVTIDFATPVTSVLDLEAQANNYGAYTATLIAYDGTTELGSVSYDAFNDAGNAGVEGTIPNLNFSASAITSIVIGTTNDSYGFALGGTGGFNNPVPGAPEPGTWALMFGGIAMIGGMLRIANARRRENEVAGIATA